MGGRASTGNRSTRSANKVSDIEYMEMRDAAKTDIYNFLRYNLGTNETSVSHVEVKSIGTPDSKGFADVEYSYEVHVRFLVGRDPETGREEYESDIEARTGTRRVKVR